MKKLKSLFNLPNSQYYIEDVQLFEKTEEEIAENFLKNIEYRLRDKKVIGQRYKEIGPLKEMLAVSELHRFGCIREIFTLGFHRETIVLCRVEAEYLAKLLFILKIPLVGKIEDLTHLTDVLDFRRLVNDVLSPKYISRKEKRLFNEIYDLGNQHAHPKIGSKNTQLESQKAILILKQLYELVLNPADAKKEFNKEFRKRLKTDLNLQQRVRDLGWDLEKMLKTKK